ncbi:ATP-dependent RNA helicase DHX58 isoform X2 [Mixophyes fleayi]|uniref:ATP-dependent RNA helicase DHX58 isoform X2 n=1 Tax=Mixophyes fleayi TaxID=3061075 RepID=UPI003F4D9D02
MDLRSYQWEVIGPALEGKNIIIWLPTGSGKTRAAVYVVMRHLEMTPNAKVAMLVNKVHLVQQHYSKEFQPFLEDKYKILTISGETEKPFFSQLVKKNDVLVCTAQILHNAIISESEEKHVKLADFTLLIIDECHHTHKDAVYNKVMQIYIEKKLKQDGNLPQILGLTASPGTGKASTFESAVDHILQICANLDTWKIMSTQTHIEDLEAKAKQPKKQYDLVPERAEDPFGNKLKELMRVIHEHLGETGFITTDFGTQMYEQKVVEMEKEGAVETNREKRTCAIHLRKYNDALFIHDTVRMKDAYEFLDDFYIKEKFLKNSNDPTDIFLCRLFYDNSDKLLELSEDKRYENPKLQRLEEILKDNIQCSSKFRGIIFTRTRQSTYSLHKWITGNAALKHLNIKTSALTGAGFSNQSKHMTQNEQHDVIEKFRQGFLNLLISTSVAEEGLDIPECNVVVRYSLMTNEISMVQARGRARAEDSCYSFLAKSGGKESRRELTNESLEDLMKRAIDSVQNMPEREYEAKIKELQLESLIHRQIKQQKQEEKKKFLPEDVRFDCRSCSAAVASGNDLCVVEESHHTNINQNFKIYYEVYTEPVELNKKMEDWVPGGNIRCRSCKVR